MSEPRGVLQGGQRRRAVSRRSRSLGPRGSPRRPRSPRGLRGAGLAVIGLLVLGGVLLGLLATQTDGPTRLGRRAVSTGHPGGVTAAGSGQPSAELGGHYGTLLAPPPERVSVGLRSGLRSGLLFDIRTGEVLWQRNPDLVLPIASLTKMMTALVVIAHSQPSDRVLITPDAVHFSGSGVGLLPVHRGVDELALLYGLLLPSGNDAAIALADHVAGSQDGLIAMMNARARALGLSCTHFTTVSGIVDQGNHSCAVDLAVLAHLLLGQPLLAQIVGSHSVILPFPIKGGKLYLYNHNPLMLAGYPGTDGIKTGYTVASGPCLVASVRRGRRWLGVVLLDSSDRLDQAERLLGAGFARLSRVG
jgi:serine-type D-Ala-D-Ala carboxypeptidase (penicillin-binding protein 5/6)